MRSKIRILKRFEVMDVKETSNKLEDLIYDVKYSGLFGQYIFDIKLLEVSLEKLNSMVGAKKIKESVVKQIKYILMTKIEGRANEFPLHTILYGPPGVGKTTFGTILSNIWKSIGLGKLYTQTPLDSDSPNLTYMKNLIPKISGFIASTSEVRTSVMKLGKESVHPLKLIYGLELDIIFAQIELEEYIIEIEEFRKSQECPKIVSRSDLVAEYTGQSGPKTRNVLQSASDVLFIDEAYSLYNGRGDNFGEEVLVEINRFMSESKDKCILIFSGYRDKMEEGIFKAQPGLKRRFSWIFELDGYTGKELSEIFILQTKGKLWDLGEIDIVTFFVNNLKYFERYGGDTLRLVFQIELLLLSTDFGDFLTSNQIKNKFIGKEIFSNAFKIYKENIGPVKSPNLNYYI
ncbi:MAG: hypothetical protein COA94_07170 [Rickettsiales bacterium]|nr:MAG: hypothetical protein COA94_07170 [Rickettsiales bacterium]